MDNNQGAVTSPLPFNPNDISHLPITDFIFQEIDKHVAHTGAQNWVVSIHLFDIFSFFFFFTFLR